MSMVELFLLLASLAAGVLLIAQRRAEWFLVFAWLSYLPLAFLSQARSLDARLLAASLGYLASATILVLSFSSALGRDVRSLRGAVGKYSLEGWLLAFHMLALAALPPFANFTWLESLARTAPEIASALAAVRVSWLLGFSRLAVEAMFAPPEGGGKLRTRVWPLELFLFVLLTAASLALLVEELGGGA
ncbi:MAG: hypothetical protein QXP54_03905 [Thermofilum sp.]